MYKAMRGETVEAIVASVDQDNIQSRVSYEKTTTKGEGRIYSIQ